MKVVVYMREIVRGVVRYRDLVTKIKIAKFFPGVFVSDSQKFVLAKISHYTVCGRDSVRAHAQSSHVYLASTLDVIHMIKCTRLSPTLAGRAWERG